MNYGLGLMLVWTTLGLAQTNNDSPTKLIEEFVAAFNNHDVEAMIHMISDDMIYMFVQDDKIAVETMGKEAFHKAMTAYFKQLPSARSETEAMMVAGQLVTVRERAHWQSASGAKSQMALAVYQLNNSKIERVWYYPAQR